MFIASSMMDTHGPHKCLHYAVMCYVMCSVSSAQASHHAHLTHMSIRIHLLAPQKTPPIPKGSFPHIVSEHDACTLPNYIVPLILDVCITIALVLTCTHSKLLLMMSLGSPLVNQRHQSQPGAVCQMTLDTQCSLVPLHLH